MPRCLRWRISLSGLPGLPMAASRRSRPWDFGKLLRCLQVTGGGHVGWLWEEPQWRRFTGELLTRLGHADAHSSAVTRCTTGPPSVSGWLCQPPGRADATCLTPNTLFEHAKRAFGGTSPSLTSIRKFFDNSHDHEVTGVLRQRPRHGRQSRPVKGRFGELI